jgi:hypothetical protein
MLWFFEREDDSLYLETRYDNGTSEFVAVVRYKDGRVRTMRFHDSAKFRTWVEGFEHDLATQRWTSRSGPILLPYGWPDKPL